MKTIAQIQKDNERFNNLCRNVFSSGEGKELMGFLKRFYVEVKLYQGNDRETVYAVAQHDLIREIESHVVGELPVDIEE
jgi:hypothetical protein